MAWLLIYMLVFVAALGFSTVMCAVARALGVRFGLLDRPSGRKAHARPVALTGGWGFVPAFVILVIFGLLAAGPIAGMLPASLDQLAHYMRNIAGVRGEALAVLSGVALMFVTGLIDDLHPLGPRRKLLVQIVATFPLLAAGICIHGFLPTPIGWILTAMWIVLLTNSFNLLDNMDGLSASVALVICVVLALAAAAGGERWLPALFLAFGGCLGGFLLFNFHPASMFMGDSGSLSIGYLMGVFSIMITYYVPGDKSALPVLMPLAIMGVPLFDTLSVIYIRRRLGKPIMVGDRNHFSHRLLAIGFGVRQTAIAIALLTGATGLLALPLRLLEIKWALLHLFGLVLLFTVIVMLEVAGRRARESRNGTD
ncbi:undecaprenyl/decaprenyl-phosphate alpha-N-acetylglucosaminyl 1-phosphate transferase [bacterium]|nr:undecaprenyl/decaprenyl-phosphate alpha-N-acetylglucosaminyl 1-phosphate transferase [bacterium]